MGTQLNHCDTLADWTDLFGSMSIALVSDGEDASAVECSVSYDRSAWYLNTVSSTDDVEVVARVKGAAGETQSVILAAISDVTGYRFDVTPASGEVGIGQYVSNGSGTIHAGVVSAGALVDGGWNWIRARYSGGKVSVKAWGSGESEPAGWDILDATPLNVLPAGRVGLYYYNGTQRVDTFGVGTAGDAAPTTDAAPAAPVNNAFALDFADGADLGADVSGNGNPFSPVESPQQTADTPTNNCCVLQPYVLGEVQGNIALSNGNLTQTCSATSDDRTTGTIGFSKGKFYWEIEYTTVTDMQNFVGVYGFAWNSDGTLTNGGPIAGFASGDLLGLAVDRDSCKVELFKNGVSQGVFPFTPLEGPSRPIQGNQPHTLTANFGATPFAYAPPVGFKPLCAANLEEPAHRAPGDGVGILAREGTGVQATVSGLAARPDLVFMKRLDADGTWMLFDTVRGAGRSIATNSNGAEAYPTNGIREFFEDGYTVGDGSNDNALGGQYLDFFLQRGPEFGFDIVTWVGDGVSGRQLAHDCGGTPEFIMVKALTSTNGWVAYHKALGATHFIQPHQVSAAVANSEIWGDVEPNSFAFTVGNNSTVNAPAETYIAYVFRSVPGFSEVFSFEGNGSNAGPRANLGFLPLAMLGKNATATQDWFFVSSDMDGGRNNIERWVEGNTVEQAFGSPGLFSFFSGGFDVINSSSLINGNADTILGIAWAAQPFKYSNAF